MQTPSTINAGYEYDNVTLDVLSTLQSPNLIVSKAPFRIEMKNVTTQDVTLMNNLYSPVVDKRVKHIITELLQNVVIKQSKKEEHMKKSHFVIEQTDGKLHIKTSNYMEAVINGNNKIEEITNRIEEVNSKDLQTIKDLYLQKLEDPTRTETGGGGLGILDMAKRIKTLDPSLEKIFTYEFIPTEEENISEFSLEINIPIPAKKSEKI